MSLEFLAMTAFIGWCGTKPPGWPWRWPPPPGPWPDPGPDPPIDRFIGNVYYVGLAGLILTTVATHPQEAFSLRSGPFMLVPAIQVLAGLYYNNTLVPAATKAKM